VSEFPGIEIHNAGGLRDFGQEIADDLEQLVHSGDRELPDDVAHGLPHELPTVKVRVESSPGTAKVRCHTFALAANQVEEITGPYKGRRRVTLLATGAACSVGVDNTVVANGPNSFPLPVNVPVTLATAAQLWGTAAGAASLSIVEEYDPS
jgi:hypothetical protein